MLLYFAQMAATQATPAYSTFNSHPDGAKLLFDGLRNAGIVKVSRQLKSLALQKPRNSAVFFLGIPSPAFELTPELEAAAAAGNRLIVTVTNEVPVDKDWKPLPDIGPEVWQRNFGKGNITLVAHAQRLSNKGIATEEANRQLLRRLVGDYAAAVFDEAHLGIRETGSLAGLARHYHLQGLVAGLLLLAALFIWSRSVSFPPARPVSQMAMTGSDNRQMLAELISRHLKGQLIKTCVAEWNRTRAHAPAMEAPEESSPVAAYARLQEAFEERTKCR